jgi:uncharacterized protein (TIGR02118 family)
MVKAVFLLPRRADLTHDEFIEHYWKHHDHLVRALPGIRRCVFSEAITAPDGQLPCDAMVEIWWDSVESVRAAVNSAESRACEESLANFVDLPNWQVFLSREAEGVKPDGGSGGAVAEGNQASRRRDWPPEERAGPG